MDISIVIPCFNEEQNINLLYRRLKDTMEPIGRNYEIIFVNDGSVDKTLLFMEEIRSKDKKVKVLTLNRNYGISVAREEGFKKAEGSIIATIDSDLQNYPEDIPVLLDKLKTCDGVIGWRKKRFDPFLKIVSTLVANFVRRAVLNEKYHDAGCGLCVFKKDCLKNLEPYSYVFNLFLMSLFIAKGYNICEAVVRHSPRALGKSKFNIRNRLFKNTILLFKVRQIKRDMINKEGRYGNP